MSNTPEVKTYTWSEIILTPGIYSPLEFNTGYVVVVLDNKLPDNDNGWMDYGDKIDPEVILLYHTKLKIFRNLPIAHMWFKFTFIKTPMTLIIQG